MGNHQGWARVWPGNDVRMCLLGLDRLVILLDGIGEEDTPLHDWTLPLQSSGDFPRGACGCADPLAVKLGGSSRALRSTRTENSTNAGEKQDPWLIVGVVDGLQRGRGSRDSNTCKLYSDVGTTGQCSSNAVQQLMFLQLASVLCGLQELESL